MADSISNPAQLPQNVIPLKPIELAGLPYDSVTFESADQAAAAGGAAGVLEAEKNVDLHYVISSDRRTTIVRTARPPQRFLDQRRTVARLGYTEWKGFEPWRTKLSKREASAGEGDLRFNLITLAELLDQSTQMISINHAKNVTSPSCRLNVTRSRR